MKAVRGDEGTVHVWEAGETQSIVQCTVTTGSV